MLMHRDKRFITGCFSIAIGCALVAYDIASNAQTARYTLSHVENDNRYVDDFNLSFDDCNSAMFASKPAFQRCDKE